MDDVTVLYEVMRDKGYLLIVTILQQSELREGSTTHAATLDRIRGVRRQYRSVPTHDVDSILAVTEIFIEQRRALLTC